MIEKKRALELLDSWRESYMMNKELIVFAGVVSGDMSDSLLYNTVWQGFDRHTGALAAALGDCDAWLSWYCWDNDMGAKASKAAPPSGKFRNVKTLNQLWQIIEESK